MKHEFNYYGNTKSKLLALNVCFWCFWMIVFSSMLQIISQTYQETWKQVSLWLLFNWLKPRLTLALFIQPQHACDLSSLYTNVISWSPILTKQLELKMNKRTKLCYITSIVDAVQGRYMQREWFFSQFNWCRVTVYQVYSASRQCSLIRYSQKWSKE